jgi:hypothetical protein
VSRVGSRPGSGERLSVAGFNNGNCGNGGLRVNVGGSPMRFRTPSPRIAEFLQGMGGTGRCEGQGYGGGEEMIVEMDVSDVGTHEG